MVDPGISERDYVKGLVQLVYKLVSVVKYAVRNNVSWFKELLNVTSGASGYVADLLVKIDRCKAYIALIVVDKEFIVAEVPLRPDVNGVLSAIQYALALMLGEQCSDDPNLCRRVRKMIKTLEDAVNIKENVPIDAVPVTLHDSGVELGINGRNSKFIALLEEIERQVKDLDVEIL